MFFSANVTADVVVVRGSGTIICPVGYTLTSVSSGTNNYASCEGMPVSGAESFNLSGTIAPKCEYWNGEPTTDPNVIGFCAKNLSGNFAIARTSFYSYQVNGVTWYGYTQNKCPANYMDTGGTPPMTGYVAGGAWQTAFCYQSCSGNNTEVVVQQPSSQGNVSCPVNYKIISLVTPSKIMTDSFPFQKWTGSYDWNNKINNATIFTKGGCFFNSTTNPSQITCSTVGAFGIIPTPAVLCGKV